MILLEGKIPQEERALLSIFNSSEVSVGMNFWILDPRVSRLCSCPIPMRHFRYLESRVGDKAGECYFKAQVHKNRFNKSVREALMF